MSLGLRRLAAPLAPPLPDSDPTPPVPVRDENARALLAIAHTCALPAIFQRDEAIVEARDALARVLAARLLGAPDAHTDGEVAAAADEIVEIVRPLLSEPVARRLPASLEKVGDALLGEAGYVLRVRSLEYHGSVLALARDGRQLVALNAPSTVAQTHVWLLQPLYERVEAWVAEDARTAREREASRWWFSRWRAPRPFRGDEFARGVREQEFSLVARPYACLGVSPLEYVVEDDLLGDAGPRERHVARCLAHSMVGAWRVEARNGDDVTLRHPLEGTRLRVREHAPVEQYGAGAVILGRLIPFGDGTWLRSPGALIVGGQEGPDFARRLAEGVEKGSEEMYPEAAAEGLLHMVAGVRGLPREVRPDASPDEAVELLKQLHQDFQDCGHAETVDPETDSEARALAEKNPGTMLFRFSVDIVLGQYTSALFPLSQKSRAVRQAKKRIERDARKRRR